MNLSELRRHLRPMWPALDVHVHPLAGLGALRPASAREDARLIREAARRAGVEKACLFSVHPAHHAALSRVIVDLGDAEAEAVLGGMRRE